jgi:hypothetical protein
MSRVGKMPISIPKGVDVSDKLLSRGLWAPWFVWPIRWLA